VDLRLRSWTSFGEGVTELLTSKQWPADEVMKVELALQEILANAIRHGRKNDPSKQVFDAGAELLIVVRDPGAGFDVTTVPSALEGGNLFWSTGENIGNYLQTAPWEAYGVD